MAKPITSSDLISLKVKINGEMSEMEERILSTLRKEIKAQVSASLQSSTTQQAQNVQSNTQSTQTTQDSNKQLALMFENEKSALMLATNKEVSYAIEVYKRETNAKIDEIVKGISQHIIPSIKETRQMIIDNVIQDGMESVADYRQSVWREFEGEMNTRAITDGSKPKNPKQISPYVSTLFGEDDDDI